MTSGDSSRPGRLIMGQCVAYNGNYFEGDDM
jgi:hypothetical protein